MKVTLLSGGVGGARMARGFEGLPGVDLTVIVNIGDDSETHGLYVSPDLDTVVYTLAGMEGKQGWGRLGDTFAANEELGRLGLDNTFMLGDRDLALKIYRTHRLISGDSLSEVTERVAEAFSIEARIIPMSDDPVRTEIGLDDGSWISFQEYFVHRRHQDEVASLRFAGHEDSRPAPGVLDSIEDANILVIGPSNPPLSIWPILSVPRVREAVARHPQTVAVSPLIGGRALKGPADKVLRSLGMPEGNAGVATAYEGLIQRLVIAVDDRAEAGTLPSLDVQVEETRIDDPSAARRLASAIIDR